jgi:hypothetical protein
MSQVGQALPIGLAPSSYEVRNAPKSELLNRSRKIIGSRSMGPLLPLDCPEQAPLPRLQTVAKAAICSTKRSGLVAGKLMLGSVWPLLTCSHNAPTNGSAGRNISRCQTFAEFG